MKIHCEKTLTPHLLYFCKKFPVVLQTESFMSHLARSSSQTQKHHCLMESGTLITPEKRQHVYKTEIMSPKGTGP